MIVSVVFDSLRHSASRRNPDSELYDHACELLGATAAIRRSIADPGAKDAVPALLGCIEVALRDLAVVADELERADAGQSADKQRARAAHGHHNLQVALDDAAIAARVAQALAARAAAPR